MLSTGGSDDIEWIKARALEIQAEIERKDGPYRAEIVPGVTPTWHLLRTTPSGENEASRYLVDRGFGIYLPMMRRSVIARGVKRVQQQLMFPGYVFLFVWDVKRHWRRIKTCPGVRAVVCIAERPLEVPLSVISRLQGLEVWQDQTLIEEETKKRWRRTPKHLKDDDPWDGRITISIKSYWRDMASTDPSKRVSALHRALGLAA